MGQPALCARNVAAMADPISHVNVWADDDELVVTWRGGSEATSVFVSDDPDDAGVEVRAPDAAGRAVVRRRHRRQYIHLFEPDQGFVVAAERRLPMDGPDNLRDIGGYPTIDGSLLALGEGVSQRRAARALRRRPRPAGCDLGISRIFDLRSDAEVEAAPDRLPDGVDYEHLPMSSDVAQQRGMLQRIIDGDLPKFDQEDMVGGYLAMLDGFGDFIGRVIHAVADDERVLFHCTAGKDRTGVMAMTLLGLAGVAEPYLLDDYEITARYRNHQGGSWFADQIRAAGHDPDDFETMWQTPRPVMRMTLEGLRERWGDHDSYVRSIGVPDDVAARARAALRTF